MFTVPIVFLALWTTVSVRASSAGVRKRGVGYSSIALIAVAMLLFGLLPLTYNVGALALLGVGFFVIGWREQCQPVWLAALVAVAIGLATNAEPIRRTE